jgi:DNA polymerase-3 subunit epsilon
MNLALTLDDALAESGQLLSRTTFVIVDLETTGGRTADSGITEIGAVKVCGGETIAEFRTFVNPGMPIPPFITVLTGITEQDVVRAPTQGEAIASFLEFSGFANREDRPVLVAHNAGFDVSFLKQACEQNGYIWPKPVVQDTVNLARKILRGGEVRNKKLGTLAQYFNSPTSPTHRALDDARATVHVLHGLIERVGNLGINTFEGLLAFDGQATERRRRKRHLAEGLPTGPGVYVFYDASKHPLYIGKSNSIRKRVMSYFTAAETRSRMTNMVELAARVDAIECETDLEAAIREIRLINELRPRFNHASRNPERTAWVVLTQERFPRLSVVRQAHPLDEERTVIGPFAGRDAADLAINAVHEAIELRQCKVRITSKTKMSACALHEMKKCVAPCLDPTQTSSYEFVVQSARQALTHNQSSIETALLNRISALADSQRFEEAAAIRDRLDNFSNGVFRAASIRALSSIPEIIAASPTQDGGWDIHVIRHGWLAGSVHAPQGNPPLPFVESIAKTAATQIDREHLVRETELILRWLTSGKTRMVQISDGYSWAMPIGTRPYSADKAKRWLTDIKTVNSDAAEPLSID